MTFHDDSSKKEPAGKKAKIVPIAKRRVFADCQVGDVVEFDGGKQAVVTAFLNGGPFGRYLDADGKEGSLVTFPPRMPMVRLRGYK